MFPILSWNANADGAVAEAIEGFNLEQGGWRGFESLYWVRALNEKYPAIHQIARYTSTISGVLLDEVETLFKHAEASDRSAIRSYFVAKLALEKLSLMNNGAGAGMGDKYGAFLQIFQLTMRLVG